MVEIFVKKNKIFFLLSFKSVGSRYCCITPTPPPTPLKIAHVSLSPQIKMKNRPCVEYPSGIETNQVNFLWKKKNIWICPICKHFSLR